jgi:hypothetical protein
MRPVQGYRRPYPYRPFKDTVKLPSVTCTSEYELLHVNNRVSPWRAALGTIDFNHHVTSACRFLQSLSLRSRVSMYALVASTLATASSLSLLVARDCLAKPQPANLSICMDESIDHGRGNHKYTRTRLEGAVGESLHLYKRKRPHSYLSASS